MKLCVFGASGKVGRLVVAEALRRDHQVVVVVHKANPLAEHGLLQVKQGDVNDADFVTDALRGSTAVISCLGSWGTKSKDIVSTGTANITRAMSETGITRIITVTGAGAHAREDRPGIFERTNHMLLSVVAGRILTDGENHLATLAASGLDWTCIRSPVMTGATYRATYGLETAFLPPWATIPRQAVAHCLVDQLEQKEWIGKAPFITKGNRKNAHMR
jgi:putative NADH-flavin reductase